MEGVEIRSDDRVLFIPIPDEETLRLAAGQAALVVGIGTGEAVRAARRVLAACHNVMLVPASEDGQIPWKEEFFTKVIAPNHPEADTEMLRVLAPGGSVHLRAGGVQRRAR